MSEASPGNRYAPPTAAVEDRDPPSRFVLGCVVLLHAFWCSSLAFMVSTRLGMSPRRPVSTNVLWALAAFATLYAFTIYRLWRRSRWAWFVSWLPVLGMSIFGLGVLVFVRPASAFERVLLGGILVPSLLLLPLQWKLRSELR